MESDETKLLPGMDGKPSPASTPKPLKRCAPELITHLESASNGCVPKRKLILECDTTPLASPRSCLSTPTVSTPGRMVSAGRVNITRGIQTIRPETTNRYCQVSVARIRKPTATIHVQTEESLVPPVPVFNEIGCQTDEPLPRETCVGVTQTEAFAAHPVQRDEVGCQTVDMMTVDEPIETRSDRNVAQAAEQQQDQLDLELEEAEKSESTRVSVTNMLNDFAKQYGIDLQSPVEKKRPKSGSKKKEIEHLQECLANKTYKAMASKVNEKLGNILEKHITEYGRETVASRERLIRWTKSFIRRQQRQNRAAAASAVPSRKIVLVRKVVRAPQRPAVEEKGVQCVPGLDTVRITVGTQWQRQKPTVPGSRCVKPNCPATPKNWTTVGRKPSKEGNNDNESNKENIPPNHQNRPLY